MKKFIIWSASLVFVAVIAGFAAFKLSPWPGVMAIRYIFDAGAAQASNALQKHLPQHVVAKTDIVYDEADPDARFDLYFPENRINEGNPLPVIVWVHGGAWVSGYKTDIANYAKIIASKGYAVVSVDYTTAPTKHYPTPLKQINRALGYINNNAESLGIDSDKIVLAGDSAGAHIVSQIANVTTSESYAALLDMQPEIRASQLKAMLLYCGAYDLRLAKTDGVFGGFLKTVLWAYSGERDFANTPLFETASVTDYVTPAFPPTFISAGNADPLLEHSIVMAKKLQSLGVRVDSLFFPKDYEPALKHEYQFNLDEEAGKKALEQSLQFIQTQLTTQQ